MNNKILFHFESENKTIIESNYQMIINFINELTVLFNYVSII
jgi:hypothetical protein